MRVGDGSVLLSFTQLEQELRVNDPNALSTRLRKATRQISTLEANQAVLARKYNIVLVEATAAREAAAQAEATLLEVETTLRNRFVVADTMRLLLCLRLISSMNQNPLFGNLEGRS